MIFVFLQKCENSVAQDLDSTAGHTTHPGRVLWNCGNQEGFRYPLRAKNQYRKFETNIPRKEWRGHNPNLHIHVFVSD